MVMIEDAFKVMDLKR